MAADSYYDEKRADHAVAFIQQLKHTTTTEWAGKPFILLPWQEKIIRDVFGTIKPNGARQFSTAFIEVPKKSGKSELAAAVALYLLCADEEIGAQIYSVANDRSQAALVFDVAYLMAMNNPVLAKYCKFVESQKRIIFKPTHSFYVATSSEVKNKYGLNCHGVIFDELLGQTERELYDVMTKGSGSARKQPLNFVITTAGNDKTTVCYEEHCYALDLLHGRKEDPSFYPVVFAANDDEDWTDPKVWERVNPSYGITVKPEYFHSYCLRAKDNVAIESEFRQFYLNQWLSSSKQWLQMDKYDKGSTSFDIESLRGKPCYGGLDLATTDDIAAFVLIFPPELENERGEYIVLPFFWIPRENMERRVKNHHVPYAKWEKEGFLEATEGNIIHYDFVEEKILALGKLYNIREIAYDRWGAEHLVQHLRSENFEMIDFGQGFRDMSPPSKELHRLVLDGRLRHGGNPILRWMFENVYIETDAAANIKPSKKKSREKIDGAVATIMALDRAIAREDVKKPQGAITVYDGVTDTFISSRDMPAEPKTDTNGQRRYTWDELENW